MTPEQEDEQRMAAGFGAALEITEGIVNGMTDHTELLSLLDEMPSKLAKNAAAAIRSLQAQLEAERETWFDEAQGATWNRPTAWAYAQVCRVRHELEQDLNKERKANDMLGKERDAFQEAMERERKARENADRVAAEFQTRFLDERKAHDDLKRSILDARNPAPAAATLHEHIARVELSEKEKNLAQIVADRATLIRGPHVG
jgi:hypothetical protein